MSIHLSDLPVGARVRVYLNTGAFVDPAKYVEGHVSKHVPSGEREFFLMDVDKDPSHTFLNQTMKVATKESIDWDGRIQIISYSSMCI